MTGYPWPNLVTMFLDQAARRGGTPFMWAKRESDFVPSTWQVTAQRVTAVARALRGLGLESGDRVVLVSENRPEWVVADLGVMAAGGITTPAYVTNTVEDHLHILTNSGARGAIVSTRKLAERLLPAAHQASDLKWVIAIEPPAIGQHLSVDVLAWEDLIEKGMAMDGDVAEWAERISPDATACIIYTSGTGGLPKGVMTAHRAILHNCSGAQDALMEVGLDDEVFLSFLPLSHSYEHTAGLYFPISIGAQIYFAEGVEALGRNMQEVRPTIMTAVPRLYEMIHQKTLRGVEKAGGTKEKLFHETIDLGRRRYLGSRLSFTEKMRDTVLESLIRSKVRNNFGGRLKAFVSGGGPLNTELGLFFTALGVRILQGYGLTESGPVISVNRAKLNKIHTVGPPISATEVRIAEDGEILCRGDLVMQGYWHNDTATAETIKDGWLYTGDVGEIDGDGYIIITDRKKDIIVNSGGDNISPQRVEGLLTLEPEITQAMVYGDRRPHLVALLVPDGDWLNQWLKGDNPNGTLADVAEDPDLHAALRPAVDRVNQNLSAIEKVRKFVIAAEPFGIENGQMTPTLKIRRHVLKDIYGERLEGLYG